MAVKKLLLLATLFVLFSARAWAANTYDGATKFNIDTSVSASGLAILKGSAPSLTDYIYVFNSATLTMDISLNCASVAIGRNSASTETVAMRIGYFVAVPGTTLTFGTNVLNEGMMGSGILSAWYFECTSALPCTVTDANTDKWSNRGTSTSSGMPNKIIATYTTFEHQYAINQYNGQNSWDSCTFLDCSYGWNFTTGSIFPASARNVTFQGCVIAINDISTATPSDWLSFFARNEIKFIGNSDGNSELSLKFGTTSGITRYFYGVFSPVPVARHKCLGKNCRLGGL